MIRNKQTKKKERQQKPGTGTMLECLMMYSVITASGIMVCHISYAPPLLIPLSASQCYHVHKKHGTWLGLTGKICISSSSVKCLIWLRKTL